MVLSMTGFARQCFELIDATIVIEIRTLNHRSLDIHVRLPEFLTPLEMSLRRMIKDYIYRGRVDVRISYEGSGDNSVQLNKAVYDSYIDILTAIVPEGKLSYDPVNLLNLPGILTIPQAIPAEDEILSQLQGVLRQLVSERRREGTSLWQDIEEKTANIGGLLAQLEVLASRQQEEVGANFQQRLLQLGGIDDSRILTEAALLVEKADINEELVRLKAHLEEFQNCSERQEPIGRRLEFLGQEMLRETNTIGAKSALYEVSKIAVDIKSQLERIREQVQNIE